ncbi:hypothetical protein NSPZN2_10226 [Nitrospira defluvii]|uniref:Uncharacterized protein n=1 Tax=Nitrospira defluvii TaxID=330214 RepID=A0ABM8QDD0_9BACT|nr:hypothetical protein NSPZN2_10226 [Nitrospira defluvii]
MEYTGRKGEGTSPFKGGSHVEQLTTAANFGRIVNSVYRQGRSEAHGARNNERHVCARPRVGERAVS